MARRCGETCGEPRWAFRGRSRTYTADVYAEVAEGAWACLGVARRGKGQGHTVRAWTCGRSSVSLVTDAGVCVSGVGGAGGIWTGGIPDGPCELSRTETSAVARLAGRWLNAACKPRLLRNGRL